MASELIYKGARGKAFQNLIVGLLKRGNLTSLQIKTFTNEQSMKIYDQAFTSSSANPIINYEMFEQLGDVTVNKFIVWYMYRRFPQLKCPQGVKVVARLRINYGARQSFAMLGDRLGLWDFISASEEERSRRKKDLLEDCVESVIGATEMLIDSQHRPGVGQIIVSDMLTTMFDEIPISLKYEDLYDAKTRLKELYDFHKGSLGQLKYTSVRDESTGIFVTTITDAKFGVRDGVIGKGSATKQKDAEQRAADVALITMKKKGFVKAVPPEYEMFSH
jgi:dsRNA-specific ribonuclease